MPPSKRLGQSAVRVVIDTNVLVSGTIVLLGFPARIVNEVLNGTLLPAVSPRLLDEYVDVMRRPHITRKYPEAIGRMNLLIELVGRTAIHVSDLVTGRVVSDPDDDLLLACALEGEAEYLISGDEHLLQLREYQGIKILAPRDFVVNVLSSELESE